MHGIQHLFLKYCAAAFASVCSLYLCTAPLKALFSRVNWSSADFTDDTVYSKNT